jgi:hypothetical protein
MRLSKMMAIPGMHLREALGSTTISVRN